MTIDDLLSRRDMLRVLGLGAMGAALGGCAAPKRYDLVYGFGDENDLDSLKDIVADALNEGESLRIVRTGDGEYALIHDLDLSEAKAKELAHLYTGYLRDVRLLERGQRVVVVESGTLERRHRTEAPTPSETPPDRVDVPISAATMNDRKRRVLAFIERAIDQHRREGMRITRDYAPFFMALVQHESNFSAELIDTHGIGTGTYGEISTAGAVGYTQLMPFNVPDGQQVIAMRRGESNGQYARRLREFCRGKSLDELRRLDVRFDPYKNVYYGIAELMGYHLGQFSVGTHTYYIPRGSWTGRELRSGQSLPASASASHTIRVKDVRDSLQYSTSAYNRGVYGAMGTIVSARVTDSDQYLAHMRSRGRTAHVNYVTKIMRDTERYRLAIPGLRG
jgi:hypothetical protein